MAAVLLQFKANGGGVVILLVAVASYRMKAPFRQRRAVIARIVFVSARVIGESVWLVQCRFSDGLDGQWSRVIGQEAPCDISVSEDLRDPVIN